MEKWFVWKDEKIGFQYGPLKEPSDKTIIEECDSYEDAKLAYNFYCYLLQKFNV